MLLGFVLTGPGKCAGVASRGASDIRRAGWSRILIYYITSTLTASAELEESELFLQNIY